MEELREKIELWKKRKGKFAKLLLNNGIEEFKKSGLIVNVVGTCLVLKNIHDIKETDIPINWIKHTYKVEDFKPRNSSNGGEAE